MEVDIHVEQLEYDLSWRLEEIKFLKNVRSSISNEAEKELYNRSLILMLYAHFEGFFKLALNVYIEAVNKENLPCRDVNYATAAAALASMFHDLRHPDKKCKVFPPDLQDDNRLRLFGREQVFLENIDDYVNMPAIIPEDVIDTESNLKPKVIRKNLFRIGLDYTAFDTYQGDIDRILNYRNGIAHGARKNGIKQKEFDNFEAVCMTVLKGIKEQVVAALTKGLYRREPA